MKDSASIAADHIPPFIFKNCASFLAFPFYYLYSFILMHCVWPQQWKCAFISPLFKKGCKKNVESYRGISILPHNSIILERIFLNHIYECVRPFLSSKQFGLRSGRGTTIQVLQSLDQLYKSLMPMTIFMLFILTYKKLSIQFVTKHYYLNYNVLVLMITF